MHDTKRPPCERVFTVPDLKHRGSVVCMVTNTSELCSHLPKAQESKLAAIVEWKSRQGIRRTYLARKKAALLHRGYAVLDGLSNASKIATKVLYVLERPASFMLEPLQTLFDLVLSFFPGKEVLREK